MTTTASGSLRDRLATLDDGPLVVPGGGTPLEARCAQAVGFDTFYLSGYATAAWRHGQPDIGLIALDEISAALDAITAAVPMSVICDADTGYGDVANVAYTVRRLERLGAQAIQLEDQAWPKRCGHLQGKTVIPAVDHARKIAAAVAARRDPQTMIIARSDALAPNGMADVLDRMKRYADAGADLLFVDAPTSVADFETIAAALPGRLLVANMSESGMTPHLTAQEFFDLGFKIVLYPTSALRVATRAITEFFGDLRATGDSKAWNDRVVTLDQLNALMGLAQLQEFDASVIARVAH